MSSRIILLAFIITGFQIVSMNSYCQFETKVKIGESEIDQIKNKDHLYRHYIDSIPSIFLLHLQNGRSTTMTDAQKQLAYFSFILNSDLVYEDNFFLSTFDSIYPNILAACQEFGYVEFVFVLEEINELLKLHFETNGAHTLIKIVNPSSEQFDLELFELRNKLYALRNDYYFNEVYVQTISDFIIAHKDELIE